MFLTHLFSLHPDEAQICIGHFSGKFYLIHSTQVARISSANAEPIKHQCGKWRRANFRWITAVVGRQISFCPIFFCKAHKQQTMFLLSKMPFHRLGKNTLPSHGLAVQTKRKSPKSPFYKYLWFPSGGGGGSASNDRRSMCSCCCCYFFRSCHHMLLRKWETKCRKWKRVEERRQHSHTQFKAKHNKNPTKNKESSCVW